MSEKQEARWSRDPGRLDIVTIDDPIAYRYRKRIEQRKEHEQHLERKLKQFARTNKKKYYSHRELEQEFSAKGVNQLLAAGLIARVRTDQYIIM
ncbi:MAG: hypothetical protein ACFFC7_24715 [Candidatus Hermodarchaeota archaeon]